MSSPDLSSPDLSSLELELELDSAGFPGAGAGAGPEDGAGLAFLFDGGYVPMAAARNAVVADSADAGAAAEVRGAGGAIGAVVAAYAPGGVLGAAHHDDDVIAGIWSDVDE